MSIASPDKFNWEHDPGSHEDYTIDCPWGTYYKLQATRDRAGNCSGGKDNFYGRTCGRPWGSQQDLYYCKVVYTNGTEEWLSLPGSVVSKPYSAFLDHKKVMLLGGEAPEAVTPRGEDVVRRDEVRSHFAERLVLTTSVCREARTEQFSHSHHRVAAALSLLRRWLNEKYGPPGRYEINDFSRGLADPDLIAHCSDYRDELVLGSKVCEAYSWLMSADAGEQYRRDQENLEAALTKFFAR